MDRDAAPGRRMSCCSRPLGDPAAAPGLSVLGNRPHGGYRPLLRERLRWLLGRGDVAERAQAELHRSAEAGL